jgi:DNA-binding NtrC family response regulator
VLLRHLDDVPDGEAETLRELITAHRTAVATGLRTSMLAITCNSEACSPTVREAVDAFGSSVHVEALARTPERIPTLVKKILERVDPGRRHTISPAALQALVQWSWPGNIAELSATLTTLVKEVTATVIQRKHLPLAVQQAPPRRNMTLLESAERGAIIRALNATHGNKSEAASLLGMGRTTLYQRLRQLGLDDHEESL